MGSSEGDRVVLVDCLRCGTVRPHQSRGLCKRCYKAASRDGTRDRYPLRERKEPKPRARVPRIHCMRCGQDNRLHKARQLCYLCHREAERLKILDFYPHVDNSLPHGTVTERLDQLLRDRRS